MENKLNSPKICLHRHCAKHQHCTSAISNICAYPTLKRCSSKKNTNACRECNSPLPSPLPLPIPTYAAAPPSVLSVRPLPPSSPSVPPCPSLPATTTPLLTILAADAAGQLDVLGHDGDALGMEGAQVDILIEANKVGLGRLLESMQRGSLEAKF